METYQKEEDKIRVATSKDSCKKEITKEISEWLVKGASNQSRIGIDTLYRGKNLQSDGSMGQTCLPIG